MLAFDPVFEAGDAFRVSTESGVSTTINVPDGLEVPAGSRSIQVVGPYRFEVAANPDRHIAYGGSDSSTLFERQFEARRSGVEIGVIPNDGNFPRVTDSPESEQGAIFRASRFRRELITVEFPCRRRTRRPVN